jgi:hypothetical protein
MPEDSPFIIPGPPPAPKQAQSDAAQTPDPIVAPDFITLPPGIADSATHRVDTPRPPRAERPLKDEVVFFPTVPGIVPPPPPEADAGETIAASPRPAPRNWKLFFADREPVSMAGPLFIGRNPVVNPDVPGAAALPLNDPEKTLSKTHALLEVDDDTLWVTDLHSTNGVIVVGDDDSELLLEDGVRTAVPAGSSIEFGTYPIRAEHS